MTEREYNHIWYYVEDYLLGYCDFNGRYYDESDYVDRVNRPEDNCDSQSDSEQDNDGDDNESRN